MTKRLQRLLQRRRGAHAISVCKQARLQLWPQRNHATSTSVQALYGFRAHLCRAPFQRRNHAICVRVRMHAVVLCINDNCFLMIFLWLVRSTQYEQQHRLQAMHIAVHLCSSLQTCASTRDFLHIFECRCRSYWMQLHSYAYFICKIDRNSTAQSPNNVIMLCTHPKWESPRRTCGRFADMDMDFTISDDSGTQTFYSNYVFDIRHYRQLWPLRWHW